MAWMIAARIEDVHKARAVDLDQEEPAEGDGDLLPPALQEVQNVVAACSADERQSSARAP